MQYAYILMSVKEILPGRYEHTYEWKGDRKWPVILGNGMIQKIGELPWKLRKVEDDICRGSIYVRNEPGLYTYWWLRIHLLNFLRSIQCRLIYTLMVWGLAWVDGGEIPSWRCVGRKRK